MSNKSPKVDGFMRKPKPWRDEMVALRAIALDTGLAEDVKWGWPCYSFEDDNVVLIHAFKEYCAYLFFKGALMKDPKHLLVQQTENVQSSRQIRFTSLAQIEKMASTLKTYVREAIKVEQSGIKLQKKSTEEFKMADEFKRTLDERLDVRKAFESLTPGRQRGYLLYFSSAKQAKTREARVDKCLPRILNGKGMDD